MPVVFITPIRRVSRGRGRCRTVDDLVQFTAVKPDTPTFGTVIYFHAAAFRDHKRFTVNRTLHLDTSF